MHAAHEALTLAICANYAKSHSEHLKFVDGTGCLCAINADHTVHGMSNQCLQALSTPKHNVSSHVMLELLELGKGRGVGTANLKIRKMLGNRVCALVI
jgi:hypothetical protein